MDASVRKSVREEKGAKCHFCGVTNEQHNEDHGRSLDTHHILPSRLGGSAKMENLIPVCIDCHQKLEAITRKILPEGISREYRRFRHGDAEVMIFNQDEIEVLETTKEVYEDEAKRVEELEKECARLTKRIEELEDAVRSVEFYQEMLSGLKVDGEVVTELIGEAYCVTADSDEAEQEYQDWGDRKQRVSLKVSESNIAERVGRVLDSSHRRPEILREDLREQEATE